jgi:thiamine biosynthesis lipoprotein
MKNIVIYPSLLITFILLSCNSNQFRAGKINGLAQGTTYSIVYDSTEGPGVKETKNLVEKILHEIDLSLSVYNDSSVISRLNRNETDRPDEMFTEVFNRYLRSQTVLST